MSRHQNHRRMYEYTHGHSLRPSFSRQGFCSSFEGHSSKTHNEEETQPKKDYSACYYCKVSFILSINNMSVEVSANRLHKRRQRARNQEQKQKSLDDLFDRVPPPPTNNVIAPAKGGGENTQCSYADLYRPIPELSIEDFWKNVPDICNPTAAVMDQNLADQNRLSRDKKYQARYKRKLQHKLKRGDITEAKRQELWEKHGRSNATNDQETNDGVTLLSAQRGQRKAWQVENFVTLLKNNRLRLR